MPSTTKTATGGGAKNLDIRSLSADLTRATLEIPFSIPSYFALVARALGILEGIALSGDPDYRVVLGAYVYDMCVRTHTCVSACRRLYGAPQHTNPYP